MIFNNNTIMPIELAQSIASFSRSIARLSVDGSACATAFLVSKDIALTAAHAFGNPSDGKDGLIELDFDYVPDRKASADNSFLDVAPYPWDNEAAGKLHLILSDAYPKDEGRLQIMQMASVERRHLFQSGTPNETWKQALEVSSSAGKTRKVVEVVLADDAVAGFHEKIREILLPKSRVVASRILLDLPEISVPERYPDRRVMTTGWAALRLAEPVSLPPLPLGSSESLKAGDGVIIIQHPHAGFKHFVLQPHGVISNDEQLLLYRADTLPGSSGAPVFDLNMHVVAVHFLGRPEGNGGVPIEVIKAGLRDRGLDFISAP